MNKRAKSLMYFIQNPPTNPTIGRFVKYAKSQSKVIDSNLTKRQKYLLQKFNLFTYCEEFQQKIKLLRNKFGIPSDGFKIFDETFSWIQTLNEKSLANYEEKLADIHKQLYIDRRWLELVEYWLVCGKINISSIIPEPIKIEYFDDLFTGKPEMFLRIYPDTQQKDVVNSWEAIERYQGLGMVETSRAFPQSEFKNIRSHVRSDIIRKENKKDRAREDRVLSSQRRAFELHQDGKSYIEIAQTLKDEKFLKSCTYSDVGNLIRRFRLIVHNNKLD